MTSSTMAARKYVELLDEGKLMGAANSSLDVNDLDYEIYGVVHIEKLFQLFASVTWIIKIGLL